MHSSSLRFQYLRTELQKYQKVNLFTVPRMTVLSQILSIKLFYSSGLRTLAYRFLAHTL